MNKNILQSFQSESTTCIKLLSLKGNQHETLAYCRPLFSLFALVNENANSSFATTIAVSLVKLYTKQHCAHKSELYQAWWNGNETKSDQSPQINVTQRMGLKNESLNESFGSPWAYKVKINTYYKTVNECVFWPCRHVNLLLGTPRTKIWTFHYP